MALRKTERQRRQSHLLDDLPVLPDDFHVLSFREWCEVASIGQRTGRRIIKSGSGPTVTRLTEKRIGITRRHHRLWLAQRATA